MPVTVDSPASGSNLSRFARSRPSNRPREHDGCAANELVIGLLNNMSDGALEATERQFISLLGSAAAGFSIRLSLYHFPEIPRGKIAKERLGRHYLGAETLLNTRLDGLIVTGREPLFPSLRDEPYWNSFVQVHEWARESTFSTIWSCLAAHAAVLHSDGIKRQLSQYKHCGVFDCARVSDHPIITHLPAPFRLPHSRWNGLPEAELVRCGYQVLTRAEGAGVDCFAKHVSSLFVYFQGHPEYEPNTLLLEYRRDVNRYVNGESNAYPSMPRGYFDEETERKLSRIQNEVDSRTPQETMALLESVTSSVGKVDGWSTTASTLYKNWLGHLYEKKRTQEQNAEASSRTCMSRMQEARPSLPLAATGGVA